MRNATLASLAVTLVLFPGCARQEAIEHPAAAADARAELVDAGGRVLARALARDNAGRLTINVEAEELPPGTYATHVHAVGRCDPPGFESAGPHWNPTERQHGSQNPQGQHLGDLPNLLVGADGQGSFELTIGGARLSGGGRGLLDRDGSALVIHAGPDDYRTDPSGNSGARIACGVFR
jgi:superoxide dismutase, Cu-Zn family